MSVVTSLGFFELIDKKLTHSEEKALYNFIVKTAICYLRAKSCKNSKFCTHIGGTEIEDIATDTAAALLSKREGSEYLVFQHSLAKLNVNLENDAQAHYFFYRIILNKAEQEKTKALKHADPIYDKILNSINYYIDKLEFAKTNYFGSVYLVQSKNERINSAVIDRNSFDSIEASFFNKKFDILLTGLFIYLEEKGFYPAIPLNCLIFRLKLLSLPMLFGSEEVESTHGKLVIDQIVDESLKKVTSHLKSNYLNKNKLNVTESDAISKALLEISVDLKDGGMNGGLYDYFNRQLPVEKSEYDKKYHHILDYHLRILKKEIALKLKD